MYSANVLTVGGLRGARQVQLRGVAVACDDDGLLHHVDAVALHELLQQVEDLLCTGALEGKDTCRNRESLQLQCQRRLSSCSCGRMLSNPTSPDPGGRN